MLPRCYATHHAVTNIIQQKKIPSKMTRVLQPNGSGRGSIHPILCFFFLCISPTSEDGKSRRITLGSSSPWCSTSGGHCWIPHPLSCHQSGAGFAHTDQSPELFSIFPHRTLQKRGVQEQPHNLFVPWKELERMHQTTWQARTSGCTENRKTSFLINSEQSWLSKAPIVLLNFSSHRTAVRCRLLCCCKWRKIKTVLGITSFPIKSRLPIHHQHFKLFCSIQALWHCGCFYHESLTKQGCPPVPTERKWELCA